MKLSESQLLEYRLQMEGLISEREGMIALNHQRQYLAQPMAYLDTDFFNIQVRFAEIHKRMLFLMDK